MNINPINFSILNNNNIKQKNVSDVKTKPLASDTFKKSDISFGSSYEFGSFFFGILSSLGALSSVLRHEKNERQLEAIMEALGGKQIKNFMKQNKPLKMENFLLKVGINDEYLNKLFFDSGIRTIAQFESFLKIYNDKAHDCKKTFKGQSIEAVEIYGHLKYKDDLSRFSEILLYLYNEEMDSDNPDLEKLNKTTEFLKNAGLSSFKDFDKNFSHLKNKFNNFEDISDKADAIEYLQSTYDDKISQLEEIISENPSLKTSQTRQVYSSINDIVDFVYDENGNDLKSLSDILQYTLQSNKFKGQSLRLISSYFNGLEHPKDKIIFYHFLNDWDISINDFNNLSLKGIIEDPYITLNKLVNKNAITQAIKDTEETDEKSAFEFYKNFSDILNAVYDEQDENIEGIKNVLDISKRFNVKNSTSFLMFYNKAAQDKKKSLTIEEVKGFIELFKYSKSDDIFKEAQAKNISVVELLRQEKSVFESVEKDIENFIIFDETNYFAGQNALDIFNKFHEEIIENPQNISSILQDIVDFDILSAQQLKQKTKNVTQFCDFFLNKQDLLKFFSVNKICFDETQEDNQYQQNCFDILNAVYDKNNMQKSQETIKYLAKSGFLIKSKAQLSNFLEKVPDEAQRKEILNLIAAKKIPSLNQMEKFFKQYKTTPDSEKELLDYLYKLAPGVDFTAASEILNSIQDKMEQLYIPIKLDSNNITKIDTKKFKPKSRISNSQILYLLDSLKSTAKDENFLTVMPNNTKNNTSEFTSFRIAQELATKIEKSDESYKNISNLLNLTKENLKLPADCSHYIYAKAVEQILPEEFINFVNSSDWLNYSTDEQKTPSVVLHARLRAIDKFALNDAEDINTLYSDETKEKLKSLFKTIYTKTPTEIKSSSEDQRIIVDFEHNSNIIEAVFSDKGDMITVVPKRNSN